MIQDKTLKLRGELEAEYDPCPTGACPKVPHYGNCGCKCHREAEKECELAEGEVCEKVLGQHIHAKDTKLVPFPPLQPKPDWEEEVVQILWADQTKKYCPVCGIDPKKITERLNESVNGILQAEKDRIRGEVEKLPVYLVDKKFNPDDNPQIIQTVSLEDLLKIL